MRRDDKWLFQKLDEVWDEYFSDVPQDNDVQIVWGRKARQRLGSIKQAALVEITNYKLQITKPLLSSLVTNPGISSGPVGGDPRLRSSSLSDEAQASESNDKDDSGGGSRNAKLTHPGTIITINSLFKDSNIPEFVVIATIAHEMAHYAHGFHSPIERKFAKPHEGGIVHKELAIRGVDKLEKMQKKWMKENWKNYLDEHLPRKATTARKRRKIIIKWI